VAKGGTRRLQPSGDYFGSVPRTFCISVALKARAVLRSYVALRTESQQRCRHCFLIRRFANDQAIENSLCPVKRCDIDAHLFGRGLKRLGALARISAPP
jgi:hypothetical protein